MSDTETVETRASVFPNRAVYILALIFIFIGLINSTPLIPGWDALWRGITGVDDLKTRSFSTEWFYPIVFFLMMVVVALETFHVAHMAGNKPCRLWGLYGWGFGSCGLCQFL